MIQQQGEMFTKLFIVGSCLLIGGAGTHPSATRSSRIAKYYPTTTDYWRSTTPYPTTRYPSSTTHRYPTTTDYWRSTTPYPTTTDPTYTSGLPTTPTPVPPPVCSHPYDAVGDRCVFIDPVLKATWEEARYICGRSGGDLVVLDSMNFMADLIQYMTTYGLRLHDYWIGGRGDTTELLWKWISGTDVLMDTPLWALSGDDNNTYEMEPTEEWKSLENCGYLQVERYHYMNDADCLYEKAAICQLPTWTVSDGVGAANSVRNHLKSADNPANDYPLQAKSLSGVSCNYPYDLVGGRCIIVDPAIKATWEEARYMCERVDGDLVVLDSMDFYAELISYMKENGLKMHNYWVGGRGDVAERRWKWVNNQEVLMGTPLWAIAGESYEFRDYYKQEPVYFDLSIGRCGYLDRDRFHYMDDGNCDDSMAAICQLSTWAAHRSSDEGEQKPEDVNREKYKDDEGEQKPEDVNREKYKDDEGEQKPEDVNREKYKDDEGEQKPEDVDREKDKDDEGEQKPEDVDREKHKENLEIIKGQ